MSAHYYHPETLELIEGGLREARKVNALPSVTTIMGLRMDEGLVNYIKLQILQASLTLPRKVNESLDDYSKRVIEDADQHRDKAAEFGTEIMKVIELMLKDYKPHSEINELLKKHVIDKRVYPIIGKVDEWIDSNVSYSEGVEKRVANRHVGYAGTYDILYRDKNNNRILADFKTQEWGVNGKKKKPLIYPGWILQLAAYRSCIEGEVDLIKSIVINSAQEPTEDILVEHTWSWNELHLAWHSFLGCVDYYKLVKKYDPTS